MDGSTGGNRRIFYFYHSGKERDQQGDSDKVCRSPEQTPPAVSHWIRTVHPSSDQTSMLTSSGIQHYISGHIPARFLAWLPDKTMIISNP